MNNFCFVSIIIPTYNRDKMLAITLDSFLNQNYPKDKYEIIISNNNSTDNTQAIIDQYIINNENVSTILEKRQGVHYARNSAAKIAKGDILYFTDDDMIADENLISKLMKVFDLDPLIGSATGKIIGKFDKKPPEWVRKHLISGLLSLTEENKPEDLIITANDCVYSCHQAIRRDVFFLCGGFNPENTAGVWIGDGETGLGIKIKEAGYKFAYTADSIIYHMIPESRTTFQYLLNRIGNQGFCDSYTDYRKHRNKNKIIPNLLKRNTTGLIMLITRTIINIILRREWLGFLPARLVYVHRRNRYDLKLYKDPGFRKIVEIDDWIKNDVLINVKF